MSGRAQESPSAPRPQDPLTREIADALRRTEANYEREGSGPGSRFEGRLLEDVQALLAVRMLRRYRDATPEEEAVAGFSLEEVTEAALTRAEHLAHVTGDWHSSDLVNALRRRREEVRPELPQLRWAPYREFGIPDPAHEANEPPAVPFTVGAVGYRGQDVIVYWKIAGEEGRSEG